MSKSNSNSKNHLRHLRGMIPRLSSAVAGAKGVQNPAAELDVAPAERSAGYETESIMQRSNMKMISAMKLIRENITGCGRFLKTNRYQKIFAAGMLLAVAVTGGSVQAARISDIKNTKHNFSHQGPNVVRAAEQPANKQQNQICVFCHTPHGTTPGVSPLWNKKLSSATYTVYTSLTLDSEVIKGSGLDQPAGSSKLCLSCHDGTLAIGDVNVMWGLGTSNSSWYQQMLGTEDYEATTFFEGKMPYGGNAVGGVIAQSGISAVQSGFTRRLGTDLTNDHPISVSYTETLATRDGEMRHMNNEQKSLAQTGSTPSYALGGIIGVRGESGYRPKVPLEPVGPPVSYGQYGKEGQVQCASCHDPHIRDTDVTVGNAKFLRLSRFQLAEPTGVYTDVSDISCLACHERGGASWAYSAHANPQITDPATPIGTSGQTGTGTGVVFTTSEAQQRQFPTVTDNGANSNLPVWKAACLNCHDTHTVQGARKLLREGTDSTENPKVGGSPAMEEACFQCHTPSTNPNVAITRTSSTMVPDIETDFAMARHMPLKSTDQAYYQLHGAVNGVIKEVHDIGGNFNDITTFSDLAVGHEGVDCSYPGGVTPATGNACGADFVESRAKLGVEDPANPATSGLQNRHVECTDCHNPHRMVKFQTAFPPSLAAAPDDEPTHRHTNTSGFNHNNVASGALRGTYGVEPVYNANQSFFNMPTGFDVKRGDPGADVLGVADCNSAANRAVCDGKTYVTREYQICLKCHSNYGFSDNNLHGNPAINNRADIQGNRPLLGSFLGGTPSGSNGLTMYTNIAREIQAPLSHQGEGTKANTGADAGHSSNNHRSWHPVMNPTGRTAAIRQADASNWELPFSNAIGTQTMYCTDCHGSNTTTAATVIPTGTSSTPGSASPLGTGGAPWGPHGSSNNFILKGTWDNPVAGNGTGTGHQNDGLCFKCHDYATYATGGGNSNSGFGGNGLSNNGHNFHYDRIGHIRCSWCHVAIVHGWKNKAFLVNLNDVGPEAGLPAGTEVFDDGQGGNVNNDNVGYTRPPYYNNAVLKVAQFATSGNWVEDDCGSDSRGTGRNWMTGNDGCSGMP